MKNISVTYYAFEFKPRLLALFGIADDIAYFFKKIVTSLDDFQQITDKDLEVDFAVGATAELFDSSIKIEVNPLWQPPEDSEVVFEAKPFTFTKKTASGKLTVANDQEIYNAFDYFTFRKVNLTHIRLRLYETYLGFIPSIFFFVEANIDGFFAPENRVSEPDILPRAESEKILNPILKNKIDPVFSSYGYKRKSSRSKMWIKDFSSGISIAFSLSHSSFGYGFDELNAAIFDASFGSIENDEYLFLCRLDCLPRTIDTHTKELIEYGFYHMSYILNLFTLPYFEKLGTYTGIKSHLANLDLLRQFREDLGIMRDAISVPYRLNLLGVTQNPKKSKFLEMKFSNQ